MSKIFELFGYPLNNWNLNAEENRARAWCPFMDQECDGGGNRYLSAIDLRSNTSLQPYFPGKKIVQSGVCSLLVRPNEHPWIVCPRRLLSLKASNGYDYQKYIKQQVIKYSGLPQKKQFRAWSEVKMKIQTVIDEDQTKSFDYTFDYVISGSGRILLSQAAQLISKTEQATKKIAEQNGYTLVDRGELWIDDFPSDPIIIIEIMTSSTSGGDKKKRTQISMAFEDAIKYREEHNGPGINYRQVWARMVSQLIVKSQVGNAWGGKTFWVLQDVLANYISNSTALDLNKYIRESTDEVNILSFSYGDLEKKLNNNEAIIEIDESTLYAGPIVNKSGKGTDEGGFVDIVKIGAIPEKDHVLKSLFLKTKCGLITT